jgi:hypothetical protein
MLGLSSLLRAHERRDQQSHQNHKNHSFFHKNLQTNVLKDGHTAYYYSLVFMRKCGTVLFTTTITKIAVPGDFHRFGCRTAA